MAEPSIENDLRLFVYRYFVKNCMAPSIAETSEAFNSSPDLILKLFKTLEKNHILVLNADTSEIQMAMPFSAVHTAYRVTINGSSWWVN